MLYCSLRSLGRAGQRERTWSSAPSCEPLAVFPLFALSKQTGEQTEGDPSDRFDVADTEDELPMADRLYGPHLLELWEKDSRGEEANQAGDKKDPGQDKGRLPNPETQGKTLRQMIGSIPTRQGTQEHTEPIDQPLIGHASCPLRGRHRVEDEICRGQAEP